MMNSILAFFSGGLVVAVVTHFLAISKESRDRKVDFRGFLGRWLGATRLSPSTDVTKSYADHVQHLWGYHGKLNRDFIFKRRFKALCEDAGSINPEQLKGETGDHREFVIQKIEALIKFV